MNAAKWFPADPVTFKSSIEIAGSVLLDRAYRDAPVSPLFYLGRREDLAFEKPAGKSADRRHHVRFWKVLDKGEEQRPVWLGAVTFDKGVGVSHFTGAITHHIDADIDAERDLLATDIEDAGMATAKYQVTGVGPTLTGRNGGGDLYYTDGEVWLLRLVIDCHKQAGPVATLPSPPATELKDQIWHAIAAIVAESRPVKLDIRPLRLHSCSHTKARTNATMTVRAGREFLALPGPTTMPDEVLQAMHRPSLDIYSREMIDLTDGLHRRSVEIVRDQEHKSYIYISNGHGAWEAALSNVLSRGDKVLVLESGRFAIGWGHAAKLMGAEVEVLKGDWRRAVRPDEVEARLRADKNARDQGHPGRAGRHGVGRGQRHRRRSARRSRPPAIPRSTWSTRWPRSAACRSRWTNGASMSRCPARRRA